MKTHLFLFVLVSVITSLLSLVTVLGPLFGLALAQIQETQSLQYNHQIVSVKEETGGEGGEVISTRAGQAATRHSSWSSKGIDG